VTDLVIVRRKNQGSYLARATSERSFEMNSLNAKVALAALGFVIVATPALAQRLHRPVSNAAVQIPPAEHYPNGAEKTGSAANFESGAEFNTGY